MKTSRKKRIAPFTLNLVDTENEPEYHHNIDLGEAYDAHRAAQRVLERDPDPEGGKLDIRESVDQEDALHLIKLVSGGYSEEDFGSWMSYHDFHQKRQQFQVLGDLYRAAQRKFRNCRVEESKLCFRSLMLMVYLEDCMGKLTRVRVEEIMQKNHIVW